MVTVFNALLRLVPCKSILLFFGIAFMLVIEVSNPELVKLSFVFTQAAITISYSDLFVLTAIFYSAIITIHFVSYQILFYVIPWNNKLRNYLLFLLILILKYFLPASIIWTLKVDDIPLVQGMPVTAAFFRLFMTLALIHDWLILAFEYRQGDYVVLRLMRWSVKLPCSAVYKFLAFMVWSSVAVAISQRYYKKYLVSGQNTTQ